MKEKCGPFLASSEESKKSPSSDGRPSEGRDVSGRGKREKTVFKITPPEQIVLPKKENSET